MVNAMPLANNWYLDLPMHAKEEVNSQHSHTRTGNME